MASDVMRVRLHLRETRVLAVALDTPSELRVEVESTVRRPRCPACGFRCTRVHDTRRRKVRDLEVSGRRMTLVWCGAGWCATTAPAAILEEHPEFENKLTAAAVASGSSLMRGDDVQRGGTAPRTGCI